MSERIHDFRPATEPRDRARVFSLITHISERRDRILCEILRPHALNTTQWRLLYCLGRLQTRTMNEVADFLALDRTSLTRAVDKMVDRGLLLRTEVAHDRRLTEITLTAAGRGLREDLLEANAELSERLVGGIDQGRLDEANALLELMLERLVGHRAGARRILDTI